MEGRRKRSESERRPVLSQLPPVFDLPDIKRNKDLARLRADLEERARASQRKSRRASEEESLYVDATRNVGVVFGEENVGANMKKPGKESKKVVSRMEVERLMKDGQYAEQSAHPHRALNLVNTGFSLLTEIHPQVSGVELNQIEHQGFLLRSKCYLALGRLEVLQPAFWSGV